MGLLYGLLLSSEHTSLPGIVCHLLTVCFVFCCTIFMPFTHTVDALPWYDCFSKRLTTIYSFRAVCIWLARVWSSLIERLAVHNFCLFFPSAVAISLQTKWKWCSHAWDGCVVCFAVTAMPDEMLQPKLLHQNRIEPHLFANVTWIEEKFCNKRLVSLLLDRMELVYCSIWEVSVNEIFSPLLCAFQ